MQINQTLTRSALLVRRAEGEGVKEREWELARREGIKERAWKVGKKRDRRVTRGGGEGDEEESVERRKEKRNFEKPIVGFQISQSCVLGDIPPTALLPTC
ncbi:hypothetical protein Pcinc_027621 [Petrolisthes cinctipes]|uniref:Uncharacterized protein n=1 Tax=Petrolisthes cinctipes TaxID=88211 RepID=A0AAE1K8J7_PETCI|nr:hypothetical protein Pcinc_027621 [Petrolisthes cinctipes]